MNTVQLSELTLSFLHTSFAQCWAVAWGVYVVFLSVWIILQKRSPVSTISWILALAFIPYLGFVIYHFLGPRKLKRQQYRRIRAKTAVKQRAHFLHLYDSLLADKTHSPIFMQLTKMVRNVSGFPITTATSIQLLIDGKATFDAIFKAIEEAKHHVHLEYYIFEPDQIGHALRDLLIKKASTGVIVRLLVDSMGSSNLSKSFVSSLEEAGVEFSFFHRLHFRQLFRPLLNLRTHRKIVICDGTVAFTGGINITDTEDERVYKNAYHDIHLRLSGNVAHWIQQIFLEDWFYATKNPTLDISGYFPQQPVGDRFVQVIPSGPDNEWEAIHRMYLGMINGAQDRIWLTTPYFVPGEADLFALTSAAFRGVDVRLLVPRNSDSYIVTAAARSYFDELIRSGVKIWEYKDRMLHSKTMVIDNLYSLIGTANFDARSFKLNFEVCTALYDANLTTELAAQFEQDLKLSARVPQHRAISKQAQLLEATARLLSPLL